MSHQHWRDLTRKPLWALGIAVNFVGPIACVCFGRAKTKEPTP
jgi:hypothetical protein